MNLKILLTTLFISIIFFGASSFENNVLDKNASLNKIRPCRYRYSIRIYYSNNLTNNQIREIRRKYIEKYNVTAINIDSNNLILFGNSFSNCRSETWFYCQENTSIQPGNGGIEGEIDEEPYVTRFNNSYN